MKILMNLHETIQSIGQKARVASRTLASASTQTKNAALHEIAASLRSASKKLIEANAQDLANARKAGLAEALIDRLTLSEKSIAAMAEGVDQIARLPDPIGEITSLKNRPSGISVGKMRVPLGVIGIIYESRPNVTSDAAALCLKSGNATILRGGSEAIHSNCAIAALIQDALVNANLPADAVQMIQTTDREAVGELIRLREYIDVIVPRGGKGLITRLRDECRIPMIQHLDGNCHVYLEAKADPDKAIKIIENSKTQRYGTCNTAESLLIDRAIAPQQLPKIAAMLITKGVELRGCHETLKIVSAATLATDDDFATEYLAPMISIKLVDGADEAIAHINRYGSHHTDAIVTEDYTQAMRFLREVDSASVMVNASTRFADGFEYGLGAEIGISTDKIHARGPVGLLGLTSEKWIVLGSGQVRA